MRFLSSRRAFGTTPRRLVLLVATLSTIWTLGVFVIPRIEAGALPEIRAQASLLRLAYRPLCHQDPDRSLTVDGRPLATCSRCAGLYAGGVVGLWLLGFIGRRAPGRAWMLAACAPTLFDLGVRAAGGGGLADVPRLIVALPLGVVLGLLLAEGAWDLGDMIESRKGRTAPGRETDEREPRLQTACHEEEIRW